MGIDALALLKGNDLQLPARLQVKRLEDATLVHTGVGFGEDLETLAYAIRTSVGDALDHHDDARGIFVLPDVAAPKATTYDGVIEEIGEAGEWVRAMPAGEVPASLIEAPEGSFEAMMGQAMQALGDTNLADIQRALASGDFGALEQLQKKMAAAVGGEDALNALAAQLMGAAEAQGHDQTPLPGFPGLPVDLDKLDPEQLEAMAGELEAMLGPEAVEELRRAVKNRSQR